MEDAYDPNTTFQQTQGQTQTLPLEFLKTNRKQYENFPAFQRAKVWPLRYKRALIDTIFYGLPIPPLIAFKDGDSYWLIDGQQRLTTILDFMDGLFKTASLSMSKRDEPNSLPPLQPSRAYLQLDDQARQFFNSYILKIEVLNSLDARRAGLIFRRLQNQQPLTMAEKLASYQSTTLTYAEQLTSHAIWTECYIGEKNNRQVLSGCLCLIALELSQDCVSVQPPRLREFAAGLKDNEVTKKTVDAITERLDVLMNVFAGITFRDRVEIIPMYQAVLFLELQGHQFTTGQKGCLASWFAQLQRQVEEGKKQGFARLFSQLMGTNAQQAFWEEHLATIKAYCEPKMPESEAQ